MPRLRTAITIVGLAGLCAVAPAAVAVRAPKPAEARAIRAALTAAVAQRICTTAIMDAQKCAASTFAVQRSRIATANPNYAWVKVAVAAGPAKDDWFAQDGGIWKKSGAKWAPMKGSSCNYTVLDRLPKAVSIDFGAEYCGLRPPGAGEE